MQHLLENIYWAFDGTEYESQQEFRTALEQYAADLDSPPPADEKIALQQIVISVEWVTEDDDDEEMEFTLQADNGEYFTSTELLYKINNRVTAELAEQDHHFFEGLGRMDEGPPPVYDLRLGS